MRDFSNDGSDLVSLSILSNNFPAAKYVCFDQSYEQLKRMDYQFMSCGNFYYSTPYFLVFYVLINFIILNIFVAVVLEGFSESMQDSKRCVNTENFELFREKYSQFDPDQT